MQTSRGRSSTLLLEKCWSADCWLR